MKMIGRDSILISVAALIVSLAALYVNVGQLGTGRKSLIATTRPWVRMTSLKVSKIEIKRDEVQVSVDYSFTNIGKSPALKVAPFSNLISVPLEDPLSGLEEGRRFCDDAKAHPEKLEWAGALFPDQTHTIPGNNLPVSMQDILQIKKKLFGFPPPPEWHDAFYLANFWIVGCIAYKFEGSEDVHGTSFIWVLSRPESQGIDVSKIGTIDGTDLSLTEGFMGIFAD